MNLSWLPGALPEALTVDVDVNVDVSVEFDDDLDIISAAIEDYVNEQFARQSREVAKDTRGRI